MKKLLLASGMLILVVSSCTQKAIATETKLNMSEKLAQGKIIYDNECGKCHSLPIPTNFTPVQWVGIMNTMAPRSKLTEEQHENVYNWIISVKK